MGVLHVMECFSDNYELHVVITPEIAEKAISLTKFYAGQAMKAMKLYGKPEDTLDEYQKRLIETLYQLQNQVEKGKLPLSKIIKTYNRELPKGVEITSKKIGAILRDDFKMTTKQSTGGKYVLIWESEKIQKIFSKYKSTKSTKSTNPYESKGKIVDFG